MYSQVLGCSLAYSRICAVIGGGFGMGSPWSFRAPHRLGYSTERATDPAGRARVDGHRFLRGLRPGPVGARGPGRFAEGRGARAAGEEFTCGSGRAGTGSATSGPVSRARRCGGPGTPGELSEKDYTGGAGAGSPVVSRAARHPPDESLSPVRRRSEEHTSELQSRENLVCRLLLEKKKYSD